MAYWYRFEDRRYANAPDEYGESHGSHIQVHLRRYEVLRETPTGVWLRISSLSASDKRFARRECYRRFACPTVAEALASYQARKRKQISIYQNRIEGAREALAMAEHVAEREPGYVRAEPAPQPGVRLPPVPAPLPA